jgi:hypothetical protein
LGISGKPGNFYGRSMLGGNKGVAFDRLYFRQTDPSKWRARHITLIARIDLSHRAF